MHKKCEISIEKALGIETETLVMQKGRLLKLFKGKFSEILHLSSHPGMMYSPFDIRCVYNNEFPAYGDVKATQRSIEEKMTIPYYTNMKLGDLQYSQWAEFIIQNPTYGLFVFRYFFPDNTLCIFDFKQHVYKGAQNWDGSVTHDIGFKFTAMVEKSENVFSDEERQLLVTEKFRQLKRHEQCSEYGCVV